MSCSSGLALGVLALFAAADGAVAPAPPSVDAATPAATAGDAGAPPEAAPPVPRARELALRAEPWGRARAPVGGPPRAIGAYTNGCLQGAVALPPAGPGFEVMRLGRHRRYGHPALVGYVRRLAAAVKRQRLGLLMVGDLAQPRGGPTPTGHKSHQSGLDVDIGYTHPSWLLARKMTSAERETVFPPAVVDLARKALTSDWNQKVPRILELAANDPDVDRVFVHAAIKRELCQRLSPRPAWLRQLRPWHGHHDHFHVRLKCPGGEADCQGQDPVPPGDGCDNLAWWLDERPAPDKPAVALPPPPLPPLPPGCQALLELLKAPVRLTARPRLRRASPVSPPQASPQSVVR